MVKKQKSAKKRRMEALDQASASNVHEDQEVNLDDDAAAVSKTENIQSWKGTADQVQDE